MQESVGQIVQQITQWETSHQSVLAAALVGSQARGTAHAESDVDLMFLVKQPLLFRLRIDWLDEINWGDRQIEGWEDKDYGAVWSRHVYLNPDDTGCTEVEFTFGQPSWASIAPLDLGTKRVVRDGCRILHDSEERLTQLMQYVSKQG